VQDAVEQGRGPLAGHRHVDMRIGAIGDERRRLLDHDRRDIGMEVEAGEDRQIGAHEAPQPR